MSTTNQDRRKSFQSLPKSLKLLICVATAGMLAISIGGDAASTKLAMALPGLYRHLADATPSLQELQAHGVGGESTGSTIPPIVAQAVTELYGTAGWAVICIIAAVGCACIYAPRATIPNRPDTSRMRMLGFLIFLFILAGAIIFFGLYPFRSEGLLVRGGILDSSPLWWIRSVVLIGACTLGIMTVAWALIVILKSKREAGV